MTPFQSARLAVLLLALLGLLFAGESKVETDLKAKLAASEAARSEVARNNAALVKALARIRLADEATKSAQATKSGQVETTSAIDQNTESTAQMIQQAATMAAAAATIAQEQASKFNANAMAIVWVQLLVLVGMVAGFINSGLVASRTHKWAVKAEEKSAAALAATHTTMQALEKNTNSIKDALVATTAKEAFARGVKQGKTGDEAQSEARNEAQNEAQRNRVRA